MPGSGTRWQSRPKPGRECHFCKQSIAPGEAHDCWTTTESALTRELPENLRDAWKRLRQTASGFGEQRIYASGTAIMFSRKACYFFVRPRVKYLEVCVFLGRRLKDGQVHSVRQASKTKLAHMVRTTHRDEVESPVTDWLLEAYDVSDTLSKGGAAAKRGGPSNRRALKDRHGAAPLHYDSQGSRRTALSAALAKTLGCRHLDTNDFYWLLADPLFRTKRHTNERLSLAD